MDSGEQQHKKFSLVGFAQNKFMGGEYSFCLGVSSELSANQRPLRDSLMMEEHLQRFSRVHFSCKMSSGPRRTC